MFSSVTGTGHFGYYDIQYKIHLEALRLTIAGRKRSFCRLIATREAIVGFCNCWRSGRPCPDLPPPTNTRLQRHVTTNPTKPLCRIFKNMGRSITSLSTKMTVLKCFLSNRVPVHKSGASTVSGLNFWFWMVFVLTFWTFYKGYLTDEELVDNKCLSKPTWACDRLFSTG